MKRLMFSLLALTMFAAMSLPAHADDIKDIEALYNKYCAATKAKSVERVLALITDDYTSVFMGKVASRKQTEEGIKMTFEFVKRVDTCTAKISEISVNGSSATAKYKMRLVTTTTSETESQVKKIELLNSYNDVYKKTAQGWKIKTSTLADSKVTLDGKRFDPYKFPTPTKK